MQSRRGFIATCAAALSIPVLPKRKPVRRVGVGIADGGDFTSMLCFKRRDGKIEMIRNGKPARITSEIQDQILDKVCIPDDYIFVCSSVL